jgi:hypothetical protein
MPEQFEKCSGIKEFPYNGTTGYYTAYGSPNAVMGRAWFENASVAGQFKRVREFHNPDKTVLLFDAAMSTSWAYCARNYAAYWGDPLALHANMRMDHMRTGNFLFLDIHAENTKGYELLNYASFPAFTQTSF